MKEKQTATRTVTHVGAHTLVKNNGVWRHRLFLGTPTLGNVRMEWTLARLSLIIPINWSNGGLTVGHLPESIQPIGYGVADAQNVIVEHFLKEPFDWLLLLEDDVVPPADAFVKLDVYMTQGEVPIVSGLYFSKGTPSWPLTFRGRGNGCYLNYDLG